MTKRLFTIFSLIIITAMVLTACGGTTTGGGGTKGTIKVALLVPLSGSEKTFGESTRDAVQIALDEWNAKGGPAGYKLELAIEDSQCSADPAVNAANKVASEGIKYIIGEVCSSASIPISEIANAKGIVQISPTSTSAKLTVGEDGKVKPYTFRACFIDPFQGLVGAKFALNDLKAKTAFIMLDQGNDYVRGLAEAFESAFTAGGGTVVGKETYVKGDTDFSAILAKVAEAKPDVIYLPDYYSTDSLVTAQAKEKGITAPFLGGDGWDSADLDYTAAEGAYFTNHYSAADTRQIVQDWIKTYKAKYGDKTPDALATLGYDAANLLFAAIEKAGKDDPAAVRTALEGISWDGVSGKITFDANHNPVKSAVILQVQKDGTTKYITTVAP